MSDVLAEFLDKADGVPSNDLVAHLKVGCIHVARAVLEDALEISMRVIC